MTGVINNNHTFVIVSTVMKDSKYKAILGYIIKAGNVIQIAKDCGMSRSQIYRMINGTYEASLTKIFKLLRAIGFSLKLNLSRS